MTSEKYSLKDRVAFVTGGSRGLGEAIVLRLCKEGAHVIFSYVTHHEAAISVVEKAKHYGGTAVAIQADVRERETINHVLTDIHTRFGGLDILVNNAGVNRRTFFEETTDADWALVIGTNLTGAFICSQEALPYLKKSPYGRIINISSIASQMAGPKTLHYAVSKSGLDCMTKFLARYCGPWAITVNSINPNVILTEMTLDEVNSPQGQQVLNETPLGRLGKPEEVAAAVAFIASDEAAYITGHILNLNGGRFLG